MPEEKEKQPINIETGSESNDDLVFYQKSNDIIINGSDLTKELSRYRKAVENNLSLPIFAAIVSLWIPIFTTEKFIGIAGYTGESVKSGYFVFALMISFLVIKPIINTVIRYLLSLPFIRKYFDNWLYNNEIDPEKKTEYLINKCNKGK